MTRYRHASGETPPGECQACFEDSVSYFEETGEADVIPAHTPDPDPTDGLCWCGHALEEVDEPIPA